MMKARVFWPIIFLWPFLSASSFEAGILTGRVSDHEEALIGASIKVLKGGLFVRGTLSDIEGRFKMSLAPGIYTVEISYSGYTTSRFENVEIQSGRSTHLKVVLNGQPMIGGCLRLCYPMLIQLDDFTTGQTFSAAQLRRMPSAR